MVLFFIFEVDEKLDIIFFQFLTKNMVVLFLVRIEMK